MKNDHFSFTEEPFTLLTQAVHNDDHPSRSSQNPSFLKRSHKMDMVRSLVHPYVALGFSYNPCSKSKELYLSWLALFTRTPTIFFLKH